MRMEIKNWFELRRRNKILRKNYPLSDLKLLSIFDESRVEIGDYSYAHVKIIAFNDKSRVKIGRFCSFAQEVKIIIDADHPMNHLSTYPFKVKCLKSQNEEAISKGDVVIEDDVWIGYGATILSGVRICQGAVVAAGAVITKDVPPYAVVGGAPAKIIKYRFDKCIIDYMCTLDYGQLEKNAVENHIDDLYADLDNKSIDEIKETFDWFPKKHNGSD